MRSGRWSIKSRRGKFLCPAGFRVSTSPRSGIISGRFGHPAQVRPSHLLRGELSRRRLCPGQRDYKLLDHSQRRQRSRVRRAGRQNGALRDELGIPPTDLVFLTVGAPISAKGHETVAAAFAQVDFSGRGATLILNGDWPSGGRFSGTHFRSALQRFTSLNSMRKGFRLLREAGLSGVIDRLFPKLPPERSRIDAKQPLHKTFAANLLWPWLLFLPRLPCLRKKPCFA